MPTPSALENRRSCPRSSPPSIQARFTFACPVGDRYDPPMPRLYTWLLPLLALPLLCAAAPPASAPSTQPATRPISQASDGSVLLHARDVTIHGTTVRYEPKPEKNTIGFWTKKDDWVSWDFE